MKISYAITVCNELVEIQKLIPFLLEHKRQQDEIVVLYDQTNGNEEVALYLKQFSKLPNFQFWRGLDFKGHFADWKNKLTEYCDGDYIFQIDADELPKKSLMSKLPEILEVNPDIDVFLVPRVNKVEGLTEAHIKQWNWNVNSSGWVNWPDYQMRVYKNKEGIKWRNKVHEVIEGVENFSKLPNSHLYSLEHYKDIERQVKQNDYYNTL